MAGLTDGENNAFAQMPEPMLRFAEQAGVQMLNRWHKFECYTSTHAADNFASVFFAIRFRNPAELAYTIGSMQARYISAVFTPNDQSEWELDEQLYQAFIRSIAVENIIQWDVAIEAGEQGRV